MAGSIELENLTATRGTFLLHVDHLSIERGEVFAILGKTGAGKTVLMECIAGATEPAAGRVLIDGRDARTIPVQDRRLGILYQDYALFPHLTVRENVAYGLRRAHVPRAEAHRLADEMLELFSIQGIADSYPGVISGGEAQRTALARALIMEPETLMLDEPFSAVDPATKKRLYELIEHVHERFGCTIVFVTHDFAEAERLADRVGILIDGSLRSVVAADELFTMEHDAEVRRFLGIEE
ncbi:MAG: ATP-binding cassette domain-containing protein [Eggerthellaceae bacterium]|jgi:ABC-type sulfate/molybdate transport systems ATPase subunit